MDGMKIGIEQHANRDIPFSLAQPQDGDHL